MMTKRKRGRPALYTPELAEKILRRVSGGESLRKICADDDMPNRETIHTWAFDNVNGFFGQYARAREMQAHAIADETLEIADDGRNDWMESNDPNNPGYRLNGEAAQRSRLRVDQRKWYASKLAPKEYGDKTAVDVTGNLTLEGLVAGSMAKPEDK